MIDINYLLVFLVGLEFGSFANVCIYRWPRDKSVRKPARSHCPWCNKLIPWYENIPVLSFINLRGKCSQCHSRISPRYPIVEFLMGVLWVTTFHLVRLNFSNVSLPFLLLIFSLIFVAVVTTATDIDWKIIPDETSYGLLVVGLILSPWNVILDSSSVLHRVAESLIGMLVGGVVLYVLSLVGRIVFKKEAMGGGDIKLLASIGTILGWQGAIISLIFASLLGGVLAIFGILLGVLKRNQYIPFGPFINVGALLTIFTKIVSPQKLEFLFSIG